MHRFHRLIDRGMQEGFSDIHITGGHQLVYRSHGEIFFDPKTVFSHAEVDDLVHKMLSPLQLRILRQKWSVDLAASSNRVRLRINAFKTTRGLSLAIRLLSGTIPTIEQLNLHPELRDFCSKKSGLLLICGATGSGKSTTIASLVNEIIQNQNVHVITLEDPIEYRFKSGKSFVEQRELGTHIHSFDQGLIDVLRENPDVIVVGELREPETIRLTLNAAESGHLVIATLHASNVEDALYRICNAFPTDTQEFVRHQLSSTLTGMIIQNLSYMERARFRVPVLSILKNNPAIKGLIRDNRLSQIENTMLMSRREGMLTHDQYLNEYLKSIRTFSPPATIFQPSGETTQEVVYESPLTAERRSKSRRQLESADGPDEYALLRGMASAEAGNGAGAPAATTSDRQNPGSASAPSENDEIFGNSYHIEPEEDLATLMEKMAQK